MGMCLTCARVIPEALQQDYMPCRKTNLQNADVAKDTWTEGRKYTRTLVQPNGEQLSLIAGLVEEVGLYSAGYTLSTPSIRKAAAPFFSSRRGGAHQRG